MERHGIMGVVRGRREGGCGGALLPGDGSIAGEAGGDPEDPLQASTSRVALLVLYDITSSYFEGEYEESQMVTFGYNLDGKRGHDQIVIGLLCSDEGCPVGVEVFDGVTSFINLLNEKNKKAL